MTQLLKKNRFRNLFVDLRYLFADMFSAFATQGYTFDPSSRLLLLWDWVVVVFALYSVVYVPLSVALPSVIWSGSQRFEAIIDAIFVIVSVCPSPSCHLLACLSPLLSLPLAC